jgi:hypothetical protein
MYDVACWFIARRKKMKERTKEEKVGRVWRSAEEGW